MAAAGTAAGPAGPEPMPSYAQLVQRGWGSALAAARGCADCGWGLARRGLAEHAHLAPPELLLLALCALGWTALRSAATSRLFRVSAAGGWDVGVPGWGAGMLGSPGRGPRAAARPFMSPRTRVTGTWRASGWRSSGRGILGRRVPLWARAGWGCEWMWGCGRAGGSLERGDPDKGRMLKMWGNRSGQCGTRGPRAVGGPCLLRTLSDLAELGIEERRTRAGKARRTGAACALRLRVTWGALGTGSVSGVGAAAGLARPLRPGRGRSCPVAAARLSGVSATLRSRDAKAWAPWPRRVRSLWGEVARPGSAKLDCAGSKGSPPNCSVSGEPGKATSPAGE